MCKLGEIDKLVPHSPTTFHRYISVNPNLIGKTRDQYSPNDPQSELQLKCFYAGRPRTYSVAVSKLD